MSANPQSANVIDLATFKELQANTGEDFVVELVDAFLADAPMLLQALQAAQAGADANAFRRAAHSLKSNGNTFGALAFAAQARELEETGLVALGSGADAALQRLAQAYAAVDAQLRALCHG